MSLELQRTRKITEAQYMHCPECDRWMGNQYWDLGTTRALHKRGCPDHKPILYRIVEGGAESETH